MPLLTLHVLPPAFALPSISSECIAAIAYLRYTQRYETWIVIADAAEYPTRTVPFLVPMYHRFEVVPDPVEGLDAIIQHLSKTINVSPTGSSLRSDQRGHALALASHLETRLKPLVALSLYVCSENYSSATRASFASVLPFPESWTLPNHLHQLALQICSHLGIESKDLSLLSGDSTTKRKDLADAGPAPDDDTYPGNSMEKKKDPMITARLGIQKKIDDLVFSALNPFVSAWKSGQAHNSDLIHEESDTKARWLFTSREPTRADIIAISLLSLAVLPYNINTGNFTGEDVTLANPFLPISISQQFPEIIPDYLLPALEDAFAGSTSKEKVLLIAPLAASTEDNDDEDDGAFEGATSGYDNLNVGSGKVDIPWRRKRTGNAWDRATRIGNAAGAVFGELWV